MKFGLNLEKISDDMYPYRLAKLVSFENNIQKDWYIEFWVWHIDQKNIIRRRVKKGINRFKSNRERVLYGNKLVKEINSLLKDGYVMGGHYKMKKVSLKRSEFIVSLKHVFQVKENSNLRKSSLKSYNQLLINWKEFSDKYGYNHLLTFQFTNEILSEFLTWLIEDKGLSARSRNNMLSVCSTVIRHLTKLDNTIFRSDPCAFHEKLPTYANKHTAYSKEQIALIKKEIEIRNDHQLQLFIEFIYYCFTRPGHETRLIKVEHLEYDRLFIPAYNSKNKKGDWVSIPRIFRNKLELMGLNRFPGEYFLFTKDQRPGLVPVGINYFYRRYSKILESAGLKNSSFKYDIYGFKHSGNINMYLSGVPLDVIQKQNRHQSIDQTIQYLRDLDLFRTSDAFDNVKSF